MAGVNKTVKGCRFEVWDKSLRMVSPKCSPVIFSPIALSDRSSIEQLAEKIIDIMNIGVELYTEEQAKASKFRIGKAV